MTPDVIKLLKRVYGPGDVSEEQRARLADAGWAPGRIESLTHDEGLARLIAVRDGATHDWPVTASQFLAGLSGAFPRGCAAVLDFLAIRDLEPHGHQGAASCDVCGLPERWSHDATRVLMSAYIGHAGNEVIQDVVVRVEEPFEPASDEVIAEGRARLRNILRVIADAEDDETPSALEKRIAKAKVLPKTDKWRRYGVLQTLAECGVLLNDLLAPAYDAPRTQVEFLTAHKGLRGSARSDIVLPLAAWRGRNGVDASRAEALFG